MVFELKRAIGYLTDPHGRIRTYNRFFDLCKQSRARTVILGGDLTPKFAALKLRDGTLIPVESVLRSLHDPSNTVAQGLAAIHRGISRFENDGLNVYEIKDPAVTIDRLYKEQFLLHKLYTFLNSNGQERLEFSPEDRNFIARHIKPIVKKLESNGTIQLDRILPKIRTDVFSAKGLSDEELAMSANLIDGLLSDVEVRALLSSGKRTKALRCITAREILLCYSYMLISIMSNHSQFFRLKEQAYAQKSSVEGQRKFLLDYLLPTLEGLARRGIKVFAQFGNDDRHENEDLLVTADVSHTLSYTHQQTAEMGDGFNISGYSYVNPIDGVTYCAWQKTEEEIAEDISRLFKTSDPRKTVYVFHAPPYGTSLDQNIGGAHIGSTALYSAMQQFNPYILLCGHAHGSRLASGRYYEQIGRTHSFQPGGIHDDSYGGADALFFDLLDPTKHWHAAENNS